MYSWECLQILLYCGCPNAIPLEELLQTLLQHRVSPSQEVRAGGGSRVYQDQRAGLGGGGKPAFQLGKTLGSLPSWALSALETNLFPSDLWATRQQQAWDRKGRDGKAEVAVCLSRCICVRVTRSSLPALPSVGRGSPILLCTAADLSEFLHSQDNILGLVCTLFW